MVNNYRRLAAVTDQSDQGSNPSSNNGENHPVVRSPALVPAQGRSSDVDAADEQRSDSGSVTIIPPIRAQDDTQGEAHRGASWQEAVNRLDADEGASSDKPARRVSAFTVIIALAALTGVAGGALAIGSFKGLATSDAAVQASAKQAHSINEAIARIDTELAAIKSSIDKVNKQVVNQVGRTNERIEKVEKGLVEPTAKLAKLGEAVDKLRIQPAPAPVAAAPTPAPVAAVAAASKPNPHDVTGSIERPKPVVARLPVVDGWVLHEVNNGSAMIEGRRGVYEVYAGDPVPGLGRIDAIRRQDGRWVVVTSRGLIVAR